MRRNMMDYYDIHALLHVLFYRSFVLKANQALMSSVGMQPPNCVVCSMLNNGFSPSSYVPYPVCKMKTVFLSSAADTSENTVISNLCRNQRNRFSTCIIYWYMCLSVSSNYFRLAHITIDCSKYVPVAIEQCQ
jgi:hypothetical protein